MKRTPLIIIILLALVVIGIFLNGISSFLLFLLEILFVAVILTGIFWFFFIRKGPDPAYRKALKQQKKKQKQQTKAKKKKSPFKVIEGGKK